MTELRILRFMTAWLCLMLWIVLPAEADAAAIEVTLSCVCDDEAVTGMQWSIYRIGERQSGAWVLTGEFAGYPVDLSDPSAEAVGGAAAALEGLILQKLIPPVQSVETDEAGALTVTAADAGLYLAVPRVLYIGNTEYIASPLIFETGLPDSADTVFPKIYSTHTEDSLTHRYSVEKVWVGGDGETARPAEVTVDLYQDGVLAETVTLNAENHWRYTWDARQSRAAWYVAERDIPRDYTVAVTSEDTRYYIKNTFAGGTRETTAPPVTGTAPQTEPDQPKLPQTGQLWWPVMPLSLIGLFMILMGLYCRQGEKHR